MTKYKKWQMSYCPERCWVGNKQKFTYPDELTAEMAARLIESERHLKSGTLKAYRCDYGDHWHLANKAG